MERTSRILHVLVARTAFIFVIVLCCFAAPAFASSKPCVLPDTVQSSLNKNWHGWHLLQIGELRKDDQALWREHPSNSKKCPGMSQGKFDGEHSGLVFTLVRGRSEQAVLVATLNDGSYETTVLVKPARVSYFSVVNVLPAGEYKDFYTNKRVQTRSDSVGVEAIEHSITLFYLKDGRWKSLQISD